MFIFYHRKQSDKNTSYYKGILFEALLKAYLDKNGYSITLRQKHNSLEYDLDGKSNATGHRVVGEAKAHEKTINGQTVAAFVGKLLPLGLVKKDVHGLFLSTSQLSPDGEDYYRSVKDMGVALSQEVHYIRRSVCPWISLMIMFYEKKQLKMTWILWI